MIPSFAYDSGFNYLLKLANYKRDKMSGQNHYWNIDKIMTLLIALAIGVALVCLVRYLSDVLLPFFVACFIAYVLQPLVDFNMRWTHLKGRSIPAILTILEVTAIVALIVIIFLPTVEKETDMLSAILKDVSDGKKPLPDYCQPIVTFVDRYINPNGIKELINGMDMDSLLHKGTSLMSQSLDVIVKTLAWLLTLIYVLFILIDYPQISRGFKMIVPRKYREGAMNVVRDVQQNMNHYFRGQGVVALCAMVFYCIGFSIVKLPLAIPMGILVGILYMIPYFQYVTVVPVAIICFIYSLGGGDAFLPMLGKCGLVYVVSQSICDYVVTPHIMGKEMGMNPAIILLSLSVWGSLLGIIGMIIALPVTSLLMSYYEKYISEPAPKKDKSTGINRQTD